MTSTDPLNGPFLTSLQITDSSGDPDFAIPVRDVASGDLSSRVLDRLSATGRAA